MSPVDGAIPAHLMASPQEMAKPKNTLGKDEFMKLLMAQLRNQDPLKPMDHHEFATQLAQFSSLEQLSGIGAGIQGLRTGMTEESKLQALGMIGKQVHAPGSELEFVEGQSVPLKYTPKPELQMTKASIYDFGGRVVREITLTSHKPGEAITWDGKNQDGVGMPTGKYSFRIQGVDASGLTKDIGDEVTGRVVGVEMDGQTPQLVLETGMGSTKVELGKVRKVEIDSDSKPTSLSLGKPGAPANSSPPIKIATAPVLAEEGDEGVMAEPDSELAAADPMEHGFLPGVGGFGR